MGKMPYLRSPADSDIVVDDGRFMGGEETAGGGMTSFVFSVSVLSLMLRPFFIQRMLAGIEDS